MEGYTECASDYNKLKGVRLSQVLEPPQGRSRMTFGHCPQTLLGVNGEFSAAD